MTRPWRLQAPKASENDVEAGCRTILALHGYWVIRLHAGVYETLDHQRKIRGVAKGTPDYGCMHGVHQNFLLEVKRPGGMLSPDQVAQQALLGQKYGLPIVTVESADDLSQFLTRHEFATKNERGAIQRAPKQSQATIHKPTNQTHEPEQ